MLLRRHRQNQAVNKQFEQKKVETPVEEKKPVKKSRK